METIFPASGQISAGYSSGRGQELYRKARLLIPGGTQLLSKRPEMFLPEVWPSYYASARGVEVEDLDGKTYIDMSIMGVGACILGYADPTVDGAVRNALDKGVASTLNCPEEPELAALLCHLHPWAGAVRFARSGGEAMSMAVRVARAFTRRDVVAFSGYHGWTDWYLAANLGDEDSLAGQLMPGLDPAGVPQGLKGTSIPFHYNRIDELRSIVSSHKNQLAAIVMEPQRGVPPLPGYLEEVRRIADDVGAVLIFDEITSGFRTANGGIHLRLGIEPDLAVFAKAMANGYAMSAIIGRSEVMQAFQSTFVSSTNWTERIGPVAALSTIQKIIEEDVIEYISQIGESVIEGWKKYGRKHGILIRTDGSLPPLAHFSFPEDSDLCLTTLFVQLMLERGFLSFTQFKPSLAHTKDHVAAYLDAVDEVFEILSSLTPSKARKRLKGPAARRGFYRLT